MEISLKFRVFVDEGNPNFLGNNLINFGKRIFIYRVIGVLQATQQKAFIFKPVEPIAKFLREIPTQEEKSFNNRLYELSLQYEPRGAEKVF